MEAVTDFFFLGSKITVDPDCSHEIERCLLLGTEAMTNSDITLLTKVCAVKAMVFPVIVCECESWTIKKAERQRIYTFKLWCWRRLESPSESKEIKPVNSKGNQPWIFNGRTDVGSCKLQYFGPDAKSRLIGKDLDTGKD